MSSPRKIGKKSPARPPHLKADSETDSDSPSAPPIKRLQEWLADSPPPPSTSDTSPMPELLPDDVRMESPKKRKKIINLRLSFDELPPQEGKNIFKTYSPHEMTYCNLDWMANTEVRLTLSSLSLSSKEERYRPSAPTPTAAGSPEIIKPIPKRFTAPTTPEVKAELKESGEGHHRPEELRRSEEVPGSLLLAGDSRPGMFALWKSNFAPGRKTSSAENIASCSNKEDAEVPYQLSD